MKTEFRTENGYKMIIDFELDKTELDQHRRTAFDKIRKTAKVDGFRTGKVPENMLRFKYGTSIEADAVNEAINGSYREFIINNKIYPLSEPMVENIDKNEDKLSFTTIFETYPEFELKSYAGFTIEQEKTVVTEGEIDRAVNEILEKHSSSKEVDEAISEGHIVDISIKPANLPEAIWESQTVEIGKNQDETLDKQFIGMKKGEIKTVNLKPAGKIDKQLKFDVRIDKIGKKVLPELNDDFAKIFDSKYASVGDLRNDLAKNLEKKKLQDQYLQIFDKFAKKIIDAHDNFQVPPSILNKYLDDMVQNTQKQYGKNIDRDMIRNLFSQNAETSLKWEYIRHKIVESENISVSDEEINSKISEISLEHSTDIDKIQKYYSSEDKKQMLRDDLLDKKLKDFLREKNTVNFIEPSPDEQRNNSETDK
ncbi:MAG: trigger factor [Candidatus Delongbacteria bacterium]|nr:trigger factor [Candidatus Delongbacteria bacterium]